MSAGDASRARVALAIAQVRRDWDAVKTHRERADSVDPGASEAHAALVALSLHHGYQAFVSLLERVARVFDLPVPTGDRSRQDLLDDATIDVPGVRPALIEGGEARSWQEVLRFRHFLRHAYRVDLDANELRKVREHLGAAVAATGPRVEALLGALTEPD